MDEAEQLVGKTTEPLGHSGAVRRSQRLQLLFEPLTHELGELGKRAERVADEAVDQLQQFLATDGVVDHHLADQLILPLALVPGISELKTDKLTQHLLTNANVIRMFLPVDIQVRGELEHSGSVRITGTAIPDP